MSEYERYVAMATTAAGSAMVLHGLLSDLLPDKLSFSALRTRLSSRHTVVIDETEGLEPNHLYEAAHAYLIVCAASDSGVRRLRACRVDESSQAIALSMDHGEETVDDHDGVQCTWRLVSRDPATAFGYSANGRGAAAHGRGCWPRPDSTFVGTLRLETSFNNIVDRRVLSGE